MGRDYYWHSEITRRSNVTSCMSRDFSLASIRVCDVSLDPLEAQVPKEQSLYASLSTLGVHRAIDLETGAFFSFTDRTALEGMRPKDRSTKEVGFYDSKQVVILSDLDGTRLRYTLGDRGLGNRQLTVDQAEKLYLCCERLKLLFPMDASLLPSKQTSLDGAKNSSRPSPSEASPRVKELHRE